MRYPAFLATRPAGLALVTATLLGGLASTAHAAVGWQSIATYDVPTGLVSLQYGYNCPSLYPVAHAGAYEMNNIGQTSQAFTTINGPRLDLNAYNNWSWHFYWPGGAPAGIVIQFNAYCAKK